MVKEKKVITKYDVLVIGGGIIGASVLYQLAKYKLKLLLVESNPTFAAETSRGNSGVIHGGFDPEPHKVEAKMNVLGNKLWTTELFGDLSFPRRKIDSLVVAFDHQEMQHIKKLYERGLQNQVSKNHLSIIDQKQLFKDHPHLNPQVVGALKCTSSWIIDPVKATLTLIGASVNNSAKVWLSSEVTAIKYQANQLFEVSLADGKVIYARNIVNAAGHGADLVANLAGYHDFEQKILRGEYRILDKSEFHKVNAVYFKVPNIYGKGVIVAPTLDGRVLVGPTAEGGIGKNDVSLVTQEKYNLIGKIGHDLLPSLQLDRTVMTIAGSRPIDIATNDFVIGYAQGNKHFINAGGMQSPGISSAPAVAYQIVQLIKENGTKMELKANFKPKFTIF